MTLNRARRHEQRPRDLAVGQPLARVLGDPPLARGQRRESREHDPAGARARGEQLGLGMLGDRLRADAMRAVERVAQQLARLAPAVSPS
jgi:hypothetical protein